jgi:hypothetical protein
MRSLTLLLTLTCLLSLRGEDTIFSGPQVGEKLTSFKVKGVLDPDGGKELDFVTAAKGKPILLVFVHDVNRQSISMTRVLTGYAKSRQKDGLTTGVVWLSEDATEAESGIKRVKGALTEGIPVGVSPDGREGPGAYGLNRKVMLTILVGNENKVTANFALVQPSIQADLPKILEALVKQVGGKAPKLEEIEGVKEMIARPAEKKGPDLRPYLAPVIKRDATVEEVDAAAKKVEELVGKDAAAKAEVYRIANTIVDSGKLENYGTAKAQEYLKKWAKELAPAKKEESPTRKKE